MVEQSFSVKMVAEKLGKKPKTILAWREKGKIKGVQDPGGHWIFPESEVIRLQTGEAPPVAKEEAGESPEIKALNAEAARITAETAKIKAQISFQEAASKRDLPAKLIEREDLVTARELAVTERVTAAENKEAELGQKEMGLRGLQGDIEQRQAEVGRLERMAEPMKAVIEDRVAIVDLLKKLNEGVEGIQHYHCDYTSYADYQYFRDQVKGMFDQWKYLMLGKEPVEGVKK